MRLECIMKVLPGTCPMVRTCRSCLHQATLQKRWLTQDNICVMTCYYQSHPGLRGYRQRLHTSWKEKGLFQVGEQRLCDQVQMIQRIVWLSQLQLEEIKRLVKSGENNVKAQQDVQNRTGTEPIKGDRTTYCTE